MHCPNCGAAVENEKTSFCRDCGQQLDRIRAAMQDEAIDRRYVETSRAGLNLGVGLMYAGMWPALLAVITSPIAIPAALLMLLAAYALILFGSGPLLRQFQSAPAPKDVDQARRREIAFVSSLMLVGTMLATTLVAVAAPDRWVPAALIAAISALFLLLLATSKPLFDGYRGLVSDTAPRPGSAGTDSLPTARLYAAGELTAADPASFADQLPPPSVTDNTTRQLTAQPAEQRERER